MALDGLELERLGEEELHDELPRVAVFARVQPARSCASSKRCRRAARSWR